MELRPPDIQISPSNPFESDKLGRESFGDALLELAKSTPGPFVLNLDASWGQGKTTFLKMWRQLLRNAGINSLYFNAWETDFSGEPYLSLVGELGLGMAELDLSDKSKAKKHLDKAKKFGVHLAKKSIPTAIKLATMGLVDLNELTEEALAQYGERIADEQLKQYEEGKKSIAGFRAELEKFARALSAQSKDQPAAPLVVIIDEIDRCRPNYAIQILETIKHFFSVPGVLFVVATDGVQLANAVRHTYGADLDADGYLRRFFDVSVSLPQPDTSNFIDAQFDRFGLDEFFSKRTHEELKYDKNHVRDVFKNLFLATNSSLRDQERCFTLLGLAIRTTPEDRYLHPLLLCTLIVLRIKNKQLYEDFSSGTVDHEKVLEYFSRNPVGRRYFELDRGYGSIVEAYLVGSRISSYTAPEVVSSYQARAENAALPEKERERARRISEIFKSHWFRKSFGKLKYVLEKIELVARAPLDTDD